MEDDRSSNLTTRLLGDFVRQVSDQVVVPPFTANRPRTAFRRRGQRATYVGAALVAATVVGAVVLGLVYGPRSTGTDSGVAGQTPSRWVGSGPTSSVVATVRSFEFKPWGAGHDHLLPGFDLRVLRDRQHDRQLGGCVYLDVSCLSDHRLGLEVAENQPAPPYLALVRVLLLAPGHLRGGSRRAIHFISGTRLHRSGGHAFHRGRWSSLDRP
jgi:hypothetical protein